VTEVDLSNNQLSELPPEIVKLTSLTELVLRNNQLNITEELLSLAAFSANIFFKIYYKDDMYKIRRFIEFPEEYYKAGSYILSNFSQILKKKNEKAKVRIKQDDLKITMMIETEGEEEKIEGYLDNYLNIFTGKTNIPEFAENDQAMIIELKSDLRSVRNMVYTQKDIIALQRNQLENKDIQIERKDIQIEKLISVLGSSGDINLTIPVQTDISPVIAPTTNIKAAAKATAKPVTRIKIDIKNIPKLITEIDKNLTKEKSGLGTEEMDEIKTLIRSVKKMYHENGDPNFFGIKENLQSIMTILMGTAGSLAASPLWEVIKPIFKI
jgi:hypothetical protein